MIGESTILIAAVPAAKFVLYHRMSNVGHNCFGAELTLVQLR
jgi:hypothetical protein